METTPITPAPEEPRKNNTRIIIAIGAVVFMLLLLSCFWRLVAMEQWRQAHPGHELASAVSR